jgi:virginiamycin B lyase
LVNRRTAVAIGVLVIVLVAGFAVYGLAVLQAPCQPVKASQSTSTLSGPTVFGSVTEYSLPNGPKWANGVAAAPDGSVWFGEQATPGLAHLDPVSRTLVEYRWPCYQTSKTGGPVASIWGVAIWNGKVWAADGDSNRLVGLDPGDGSTVYVNSSSARFPYLLAPAPDGSLWFTALSSPARLGRLGLDQSLTVYSVSGLGSQEPIQIQFVNSTIAYLVALNPSNATDSGLYSFNPAGSNSNITAARVGGGFSLFYPQALSTSGTSVWVAQHLPSNVLRYEVASGNWTVYPTSIVSYERYTLPYFIQSEGSLVWFNEHYGNKIAMLDPAQGTLTEYSEANPPVSNSSQIQNDLTFAATPMGAWFTSTTADYVGFVRASGPSFSVAVSGSNRMSLSPGGTLNASLMVSGSWRSTLSLKFSDSELLTSVPKLISITASNFSIPARDCGTCSAIGIGVTVVASTSILPGRYTIAVTLSDGLLDQSAYIFVTVH